MAIEHLPQLWKSEQADRGPAPQRKQTCSSIFVLATLQLFLCCSNNRFLRMHINASVIGVFGRKNLNSGA